MRSILITLLLMTTSCAVAEQESIKDEHLQISVTGMGGNPLAWLRFREDDDQNTNLIKLSFDIKHVKTVLVTDINAENNKCVKHNNKYPFYLVLDPKDNVREVSTRIPYPCLVQRHADLKISVVTSDDKHYYNIFKFDVDPYTVVK